MNARWYHSLTDPLCNGTDHGGQDWILSDNEVIYGVHCNISKFFVPHNSTVTVEKWDGEIGGSLEIYAQVSAK